MLCTYAPGDSKTSKEAITNEILYFAVSCKLSEEDTSLTRRFPAVAVVLPVNFITVKSWETVIRSKTVWTVEPNFWWIMSNTSEVVLVSVSNMFFYTYAILSKLYINGIGNP